MRPFLSSFSLHQVQLPNRCKVIASNSHDVGSCGADFLDMKSATGNKRCSLVPSTVETFSRSELNTRTCGPLILRPTVAPNEIPPSQRSGLAVSTHASHPIQRHPARHPRVLPATKRSWVVTIDRAGESSPTL